MARAFLGLGSNVGDRRSHLKAAVDALEKYGLRSVSPVYETAPVGGPEQDAFLNLVVELQTDCSARELLHLCQELEEAAGRVREVRWGPRSLDVDVLWIDGVTVSTHDLQVPHPRMWDRLFVLAPLRDVAPDLVDPEALSHAQGRVSFLGQL